MDAVSRQLISHQSEIKQTYRMLRNRYRTLDDREIEHQCWLSMWKAMQKYEATGHPLYSVYYWTVRSDLKDLTGWYSRRQRHVAFGGVEMDAEPDGHHDSPDNYLAALEAVEATRRPLKGLLQEVMDGLGISKPYATTKLRAARKALGIECSAGGGRYTDEQKLTLLSYLGIEIGSPAD